KELGATKQFKRRFKRTVFDYPDWRLDDDRSWLRLRDEGDRVTLSFKQRLGVNAANGLDDSGMKEVEVVVSSYSATAELLRSIGMIEKFYEENDRELYFLDGVEVSIDTWPLIPTYVEIEGTGLDEIEKAARKLGFDIKKKVICSTTQVYDYYGIEEKTYSVLTFNKQVKRKK